MTVTLPDSPGDDAEGPDPTTPANYPPTDEDAFSGAITGDGGTTRFLTRLVRMTPFLDLHDRARKGKKGSRARGVLCFALDCLIRLIVVGLLLAIIGAVAWKTLAPLPHFTG